MVSGDERYERLKHQSLFLRTRGLMSPEMEEWKRQLWLLERLAGRDPSKLDPQLVDRFHGDLEKATMEQLKATGLVDEWLEAWEGRSESENVHALVPTQRSDHPPAAPSDRESIANVDGNRAFRSLEDKLAELEHAVLLFSERVAGVHKADDQHTRS
jgi:hypothetical protein